MRAFASWVSLLILATLATGCRANQPGKVETKTAWWIKRHVTVGGAKEANPVPATPASIEDGKQAFTSYCAVCHGLDGQNTGVPFAAAMSPPVPSLSDAHVQAYSDGQLKWIIENGIYPSGMPPSKGVFTDDDIWRMVLYIRHLPKAGSLGDPPAYGGTAAQ